MTNLKKLYWKTSTLCSRKSILIGLASVGILYSCQSSSPEENSKKSVKAYLLDSLKNQKVNIQEFTAFDTITRYDSLANEVNVANRSIEYANTELKKAYEMKESFDKVAALASIFSNDENQNKIDVSYENLRRTINNLKIGLQLANRNKKEARFRLKDNNTKSEVSEYLITCEYLIGKDSFKETFVINPKFKVVQNLN